ncbi:MAG TPA: hypothetical protein PKA64_26455, partial [Myxococcota bacterium]|nr:hypothetical protein [Myxococcota bacterium]
PPVELRARVLGAARSALGWNRLADRLATTAAHDLRSPLQGLRFILASLESPEATPEDRAEDLSMLRAVADTIEVQLHGLYDLGRRLASEQGERVDVVEVLREELLRPMFAERIEFTGPASASVLANAADIRYALLDLLRVSAQVGPGSKRVVLQVVEDGDAWVLRLEIAVYAVIGPHLDALLRREGALLLRGKARLPFAGLAFPYEVVAAAGGTLVLELAGPERLVVRVRLPRVSEG